MQPNGGDSDIEMDHDPLHLPTTILLEDPRYRIKPMQQVISALIGGLITSIVVTPLDVVKTRVQTQHTVKKPTKVSKLCYVFHNGLLNNGLGKPIKNTGGLTPNEMPMRGAMDAFVKIICSKGITGLWSGLAPTLASALPSTIIYFLTYEYLRRSLADLYYSCYYAFMSPRRIDGGIDDMSNFKTPETAIDPPTLPILVPIAAGICSRTVVVSAVTPVEMVRIQMQSGQMTHSQVWMLIRTLVRTRGIKHLWRGWPPTVLRDAPFSGTYWASYESIKRIFNVEEPKFMFSFLAGATSGAVATLLTMPFDLIATHTQIEVGQEMLYSGKHKIQRERPTMFGRIARIYRKQGLTGLYTGVMPRMLRVVPGCAIMISTFEFSKSFFFHHNLDLYDAGENLIHP